MAGRGKFSWLVVIWSGATMPDAMIYDVAERAGVSISTVSRVLNAPDQVNEATRTRVLAAIHELGFVPKAEAVARVRRGTRRIGVLAPFLTYPLFVQRVRGIATLADAAYEIVISNVDSASRRDGHLAILPVTRRLDGLIIRALPFDEQAAQRLLAHQLETVLIESAHPSFSSVELLLTRLANRSRPVQRVTLPLTIVRRATA